uniref:Reverse transcriptase domain-containing protein n=1 Tax=Strongyloides papillosus TaxID=174720 RepID=A0A0N5BDL4_STREA
MEPSRINDGKSSIGFEKLGNHDPLVWIESTTTPIQLVVNPDQQLEKFLSLLAKDLQALIISDSDVTNLNEASSILKQFLGNISCLDSGAGLNYIPIDLVKEWQISFDEDDKVEILQLLGESVRCYGSVVLDIKVGEYEEKSAKFYIWEVPDTIVGFSSLQSMGLIPSIHKVEDKASKKNIPVVEKIPSCDNTSDGGSITPVENTNRIMLNVELLSTYVPKIIPYRKIKNPELAELTKRRLQEEVDMGCYVKVSRSEVKSAHPVVIVPKENSVRICGDYTYLNKSVVKPPSVELANIQSVLSIPKGKLRYLSKLDISNAFKQCLLPPHILDHSVITTQFGFYKPLRGVFGISSIPILFEQELSYLFQDLQVIRYLDDLFIYGESLEEHNYFLSKCKEIMAQWNLPVNESKEQILAPEIDFLGYIIRCDGSITAKEKYKKMLYQRPTSNSQLLSFIERMTYLKQMFSDFSKTMRPLYVKSNEKFY